MLIAGAKEQNGRLITSGGRVLGVIGTGETLEKALDTAYARVKKISFANAFYRTDIGARAKKATEA